MYHVSARYIPPSPAMLESCFKHLLIISILPILFTGVLTARTCNYLARGSSPMSVIGYPPDTTHLHLYACPGKEGVAFRGDTLPAGTVQVFQLSNQSGGDSLVEVIVQEAAPIDFWATAKPSCPNGANGQIDFWDHVGPTAPYVFSIDGGLTFHDEYTYTGLPGGKYELWAKDQAGCAYEYDIEIPEFLELYVQTSNTVVSCTDSVKLVFKVANNPQPYTWQWQLPGGSGLSGDSVLWAKTPGTYLLVVSNDCDTVQRYIDVTFENVPHQEIYMPSSFSPNNDGINDCFRGYTSPGFQLLEYELRIFDRWGNQIFKTYDIESCWDGTFRGKEMDPAVFVWFIIAKAMDCQGAEYNVFREGEVAVVK